MAPHPGTPAPAGEGIRAARRSQLPQHLRKKSDLWSDRRQGLGQLSSFEAQLVAPPGGSSKTPGGAAVARHTRHGACGGAAYEALNSSANREVYSWV